MTSIFHRVPRIFHTISFCSVSVLEIIFSYHNKSWWPKTATVFCAFCDCENPDLVDWCVFFIERIGDSRGTIEIGTMASTRAWQNRETKRNENRSCSHRISRFRFLLASFEINHQFCPVSNSVNCRFIFWLSRAYKLYYHYSFLVRIQRRLTVVTMVLFCTSFGRQWT